MRDEVGIPPGRMGPAPGGAGAGVVAEYPELTPVSREHRGLLSAAFEVASPEISEFTFAYQWMWREHTRCRLSKFSGVLLLLTDAASGADSYLLPPVVVRPDECAAVIADVLREGGHAPADLFARVPEAVAERLHDHGGIIVTEERGRADYVYEAELMRTLPGQRFHGKQNHIRRFWKALPGARYAAIDSETAGFCDTFCREWLWSHPKRGLPGLQREVETTLQMLREREWLGLAGGAILVGGKVVAFSLGEQLNGDTFVIRAEKADATVPGAYQVINQAAHAYRGVIPDDRYHEPYMLSRELRREMESMIFFGWEEEG